MLTDHLRRIVEQLATLPPEKQDAYAEQLAADLAEAERIAQQLADPNETDIELLLARADEQSAQGKIYDLDILL